MRLFLSSWKIGNHADRLSRLLNGNEKIAVIRNAIDFADPADRKESVLRVCKELNDAGFIDTEELDLRMFFGKEKQLEEKLKYYGAVWIAGGNVFVLKRAVEKCGFEPTIKKLLREDKIVYAGYSAGPVLAAPTLKGVELVDDVTLAYENGKEDFSWNGLNLVNYSFVPHYRSDHHESAAMENVVKYFEEHKMPYKTLHDGEVMVIDGDTETLLH